MSSRLLFVALPTVLALAACVPEGPPVQTGQPIYTNPLPSDITTTPLAQSGSNPGYDAKYRSAPLVIAPASGSDETEETIPNAPVFDKPQPAAIPTCPTGTTLVAGTSTCTTAPAAAQPGQTAVQPGVVIQ